LSIGIPHYKEGCVDEVKIIKSSDSKSFPKLTQTETPSRALSSPVGHCPALPEIVYIHHKKVPIGHCPAPPDIVRNSNLDPTTRFLRELYIYTYTSNDPPLLAFGFYY
jgi:hypothetical protein